MNYNNNNNILIISTCKFKLHENEFIRPITNMINKIENINHTLIHYLKLDELTKNYLNNYSKIIIAGTALKDNDYLNNINKFNFLKTTNIPILGICAGYQILGLINGCRILKNQEIGFTEIEIVKETFFFEKGKYKVYSLHNNNLKLNSKFEILAKSSTSEQIIKLKTKEHYGFLFHLEVTNLELLNNFIK